MPLNKSKGAMYPWVSHTFTPLAGACPHGCSYCYVKHLKRYPELAKKYSGPPRIVESDMQLDLGEGRFIFVCSTNDLFAEAVPLELISRILAHCNKYPNKYLYQTKNTRRYWEFVDQFPPDTILGTTIESDKEYDLSQAPTPWERIGWFSSVLPYPKMVSIEPILDFDLDTLVGWIQLIEPLEFVSIGADSKGHNLPEPSGEKVRALIEELERFTVVRGKSNLERLLSR